jgi:hypothetical protein
VRCYGVIVSELVCEPPGAFARIVADVFVDTFDVVTVNVTLLEPAGTVTEAGTTAALVPLDRKTVVLDVT